MSWAAPNLQVASLQYDRAQLTQIITYGRPGTPMPAWGVLSGKGALQEQSIQDLVNYVESLGHHAATRRRRHRPRSSRRATGPVRRPRARSRSPRHRPPRPVGRDAQAQLDRGAGGARPSERRQDVAKYAELVQEKQENLQVAQDWQETTQSASDGQLLFMNNCARCHTRGWSYFDPRPNPEGNHGTWRRGSWAAARTVPTSPMAT